MSPYGTYGVVFVEGHRVLGGYINTSNISTTNIPDMLDTLGADKGTSTRSLRPREHMDKLSKYVSKNMIICYADCFM